MKHTIPILSLITFLSACEEPEDEDTGALESQESKESIPEEVGFETEEVEGMTTELVELSINYNDSDTPEIETLNSDNFANCTTTEAFFPPTENIFGVEECSCLKPGTCGLPTVIPTEDKTLILGDNILYTINPEDIFGCLMFTIITSDDVTFSDFLFTGGPNGGSDEFTLYSPGKTDPLTENSFTVFFNTSFPKPEDRTEDDVYYVIGTVNQLGESSLVATALRWDGAYTKPHTICSK